MSASIIGHIIRFVLVFLAQVVLFKRLDLSVGSFDFIHLLFYPYAILMLPITMNKSGVMAIAFCYGLLIDGFYNSPGVHAGALTVMAYFRGFVFNWIKPYEGYNVGAIPSISVMGFTWFLTYSAICLGVHHFIYFGFESFSLIYIFDIVMNTIFSFIPMIFIILLIQSLFRSR